MNRISKAGSEKGQAMIMGIIAMLILLIAIFFLVDIHSVIRVKVKAQTAADAAALTAANWQRHSLNLIGELNLVKACTVLVETVFPTDPDLLKNTDPVKIEIAADIITEMQSRIAFVGPMIGFGAAQQAAKNNGMNSVPHYNKIVSQHMDNLLDDNFYGEITAHIPQVIPGLDAGGGGGYHWRHMDPADPGFGSIPYRDMIQSVLELVVDDKGVNSGGIAAAPNVDFASLPNVTPAWLMDLGLYDAIAGKYWCYEIAGFSLRRHPISRRLNPWGTITISANASSFPEECEYSPIYIDYSDANRDTSASYFIAAGPSSGGVLDTQERNIGLDVADYDLTQSGIPPSFSNFPEIRWCIYDDKWDSGPLDNWTSSSPVRGNLYLRSPLKPEYRYGGAVAKMTCIANPEVAMSRGYEVIKRPNQPEKLLKGFDTTDDLNQKGSWIISTTDSNAKPLEPLRITCSALAKPLGSLPGARTPNSVKMVLPVFTQSVLIPVAMQDPTGLYDPFNEDQYNLFIFLKWLFDNSIDVGDCEFIPPSTYNVKPIAGCPNNFYLLCLQKLNTPDWLNEGYNPGFIFSGSNIGAGWLQKVISYDTVTDANGTVRFQITRTNDDTCDPPPGSRGSDPDAPRILH